MEAKNTLKNEYKSLLFIMLIFIINIVLFKYKMINLYTDFGKEIFYCESISKGEILYKDLFVLFGPFSYLFNGLIFKFFGSNLFNLLTLGIINCLSIIICFYFISRNFLNKILSTLITTFIICSCCFNQDLNNYITPYAYAMVYGINACFISILLYINYLNNKNNTLFLYLSFLFSGIASSCKYEFLAYSLLIILFTIFQKEKTKNLIISIFSMGIVPLLLFSFLFIQGLTIGDFTNYLKILVNFSSAQDLSQFYTGTFYFSFQYFGILLKSLFAFLIISVFIFCFFKFSNSLSNKKKIILYCLFSSAFLCICFIFEKYFTDYIFCFLPIVVSLLALIKTKQILQDKKLLFLVISSLCISIKSYFFLAMNLYGRYFLPLLIVVFCIFTTNLYCEHNEDKKHLKSYFILILSVLIIINFGSNLTTMSLKNSLIKTTNAKILSYEKDAKIFNYLISYIEQNTDKEEKIIILPETPILNFLTQRKSDNYYNYFVPALLKSYNEDKVIKHYQNMPPDYFFIFSSPNDKNSLCNGYGYKLCGWIKTNYQLVQVIQADIIILIFKKI